MRRGLGRALGRAPRVDSAALDAFRAPLSTIGDAEILVVGDDDVVDRASVDLWLKHAPQRRGDRDHRRGRRRPGGAGRRSRRAPGARRLPQRARQAPARLRARCPRLVGPGRTRRRASPRPRTRSASREARLRGVPPAGDAERPRRREAWAAAADEDEVEREGIGLLIVSGDDAASDPGVRALAEKADHVIAITMFPSLATGWADLVLPATAPLEREGTTMNLEGRVQRFGRAVTPPVPDELAWLAKLAGASTSSSHRTPRGGLRGALRADLRRPRARRARRAGSAARASAVRGAGAGARETARRRPRGTPTIISSARSGCSVTGRSSRATRSSASLSSSSSARARGRALGRRRRPPRDR